MQPKVCRQTNLPPPEEMMHHQLLKLSSSLVPLHQPINSHHLKDHRICPMCFKRQFWKVQLARKEKRERRCLKMSPWGVESPEKRKYQPGTVSAAFSTSVLWSNSRFLDHGVCCAHHFAGRSWQALAGWLYRTENLCKTRKTFPNTTWNAKTEQ